MAFTTSLNFGSIFLCKEACFRIAPTTANSVVAINLIIRNTSSRTYSKCLSQSVSGNGLHRIFQGKALYPRIKLISSSVSTNYSGRSVFPQGPLRMYSTASGGSGAGGRASPNLAQGSREGSTEKLEQSEADSASTSEPTPPPKALSAKDKLKQAVRDYGATVIVFHVTMSLMSLGFFYLLVQSGLDIVSIMGKIGVSESLIQSKVTEEAGKFVVAYAVHKVFAPLRIGVTLTATPFIVRKLRGMGILKEMAKKSQ